MPVKNWANRDSDSFSIVGLTTLIRNPLGSSIAAARTKASNAPETVEAATPAKIGSSLRMPETKVKDPFSFAPLILCSEHTIDRSAHLFQNKSRRHATHHFELIRLPWANFKAIGLHSFDGNFHHVFHLHDRNAFHVFRIKGTQEFGLRRRRR